MSRRKAQLQDGQHLKTCPILLQLSCHLNYLPTLQVVSAWCINDIVLAPGAGVRCVPAYIRTSISQCHILLSRLHAICNIAWCLICTNVKKHRTYQPPSLLLMTNSTRLPTTCFTRSPARLPFPGSISSPGTWVHPVHDNMLHSSTYLKVAFHLTAIILAMGRSASSSI